MKIDYINPFVEAAGDVFDKMAKLTLERSSLRADDHLNTEYDVSGVIGLSGTVRGCVVLSFPEGLAKEVVRRMIGGVVDGNASLVTDGIGELVNMVAGGAKTRMKDGGVGIALPTVVTGKSHRIRTGSDAKAIVVVFRSELGEFAMQVSYKQVWKGGR